MSKDLSPQDVLTTARRYIAAGLSVLPIATDGSKRPDWRHLPQEPGEDGELHYTWKPYEKEPPADCELVEWFDRRNPCGIGIPCGKVSSNLEVIDNDDAPLFPVWWELVESHNPDLAARLPVIRTPSGAHHIPYRCEEIEGNQKLAQRLVVVPDGTDGAKFYKGDAPEFKGKWVKVEVLFETRGQGGYIVAPGSPLSVHDTGKPYEFIRGDIESIPIITPDERALLLGLARSLCELPQDEKRERAEYKQAAPRADGNLRPGDDFNERGDVESVLLSHGWTVSHRRGSIVFLRKPNKRGRGHNATLNAVAPGVFYCFSTSAAPFEDMRGYSPFQVYALLEYNGDFRAAAQSLKQQGYGEQRQRLIISLSPPRKPENTVALAPPSRPTCTTQLPKPMRPSAPTILTAEVVR
jgi:hypothetical protein